jgi:hypothetical protein
MQVSVFVLLAATRSEAEFETMALDAREEFLLAKVDLDAFLSGGSPELGRLDNPTEYRGAQEAGH